MVKELVLDGTFKVIFVTGGAGTGKSTFIRWLMNEFDGSALLGAPTGMAAVNVGGKTLHSLCQLPTGLVRTSEIKRVPRRIEVKTAELLIIDEISMVNAHLLDCVSYFFKINRKGKINTRRMKPFGGLSVVIVGDMFQLPPVVSGELRAFCDRNYEGSAKFYKAKSLEHITSYAVELKKTYRQTDQVFVDLLSKIREGVDLTETLGQLNSRASITHAPPDDCVWLSPRNIEVDNRNFRKLDELDSSPFMHQGFIEGRFKSDHLPSPLELILKNGAQVMFTKNDVDKRWVNGSIGIVIREEDDKIRVRLTESGRVVDVGQAKWVEYQFVWNSYDKKIERKEIGSYRQFPLMLAWSVTIHKSQGRTIEKVHLDLGGGAFETGQTYVALSRCRSLAGLSMSRPLVESDILVDKEATHFYQSLRASAEEYPPEKILESLKAKNDVPF